MVKKTTLQELDSIKTRAENVTFTGQESFSRLKCLNRLAHFAIHYSIFDLQSTVDKPFGPDPVHFLDRFLFNESFLTGIEKANERDQEPGFRKVQKRLIDDISLFLEKAKYSLTFAQMEVFKISPTPSVSVPKELKVAFK